MQQLTIIGNVTRDPDSRITQTGINVCSFSVAVNRRHREGQEPAADYFRVTAWRELAESCGKYLKKGNKVSVIGTVSVSTYQAQDGTTRANMDVNATQVEFLTPPEKTEKPEPVKSGYVEVKDDNLPF